MLESLQVAVIVRRPTAVGEMSRGRLVRGVASSWSALEARMVDTVFKGSMGRTMGRTSLGGGRLRIGPERIELWWIGGDGYPRLAVSREDVERLEYRRGALRGTCWIVLAGGRRHRACFRSIAMEKLVETAMAFGWDLREVRRPGRLDSAMRGFALWHR